jgi:Zn-dependent protease/CBS domain-containing protein
MGPRWTVRMFGVDVVLHPGWLIALLFVTGVIALLGLPLGASEQPTLVTWLLALGGAAFFVASVFVHELAHVVTSERLGLHPRPLVLFLSQGSPASLEREAMQPSQELIVAASGPVVSIVAALVLAGAAVSLGGIGVVPTPIGSLVLLGAAMNGILGVINLVPAFPLDGGRILRAIAWQLRGDFLAATRTAAAAGRAVGWSAVGAGAVVALASDPVTGLSIIVVGWFLSRFATNAYRWAALQRTVTGVNVGQVMERDAPTVRPNLTLDVFIEQYLLTGTGSAFAVVNEDTLIGTIDVDRARRVPRSRWPKLRVADVMVPLADLEPAHEDDPLWGAIQRFERGRLLVLPVVDVVDGTRLIGVLTRDALLAAIRGRARLVEQQ